MERTKQPQNAKRRRQWVNRISPLPDAKRREKKVVERKPAIFQRLGSKDAEKAREKQKRQEKRQAAKKQAKASRKKNR